MVALPGGKWRGDLGVEHTGSVKHELKNVALDRLP
jgi:hypothetical protein